MIIKNLKIQMLAGNNLKMCVGAGFEISSTLVPTFSKLGAAWHSFALLLVSFVF